MRDFPAKQNTDSYLAAENVTRKTAEDEREVAQQVTEEMAEKFREGITSHRTPTRP